MKKILKSISAACIILVLLVSLGCGSQAEAWATNQMWGFASSVSNYAFNSLLLALFPSLGTTTTTTTTTTPVV